MTKATGSSELVERLRERAKAQPLLAALQRAVAIVDPVMAATMYAADPDPKIETLLDALDIEYAALIRAETADLEARLARAKEALRKCASVMGETLDKDFGFWSSPAQDDRRSRFYPAWKDASAYLKEQDNG